MPTRSLRKGTTPAEALTGGFQWGFWVCAGLWIASLVATLVFVRRQEVAHPEAVEQPT